VCRTPDRDLTGLRSRSGFHLDVKVERAEMDAAEMRVLDLGATLLEGDLDGARNWRVYADPAGHPFCLCAC
jgi:hypothetical protein